MEVPDMRVVLLSSREGARRPARRALSSFE
jgi:hypothetical protein